MTATRAKRGASVDPIMHRAARLEDAFHEFRARRARKHGFLATVVPYTGYGSGYAHAPTRAVAATSTTATTNRFMQTSDDLTI